MVRLTFRSTTMLLACLFALFLSGCAIASNSGAPVTQEIKQGDLVQFGSYYTQSDKEKSPLEWVFLENLYNTDGSSSDMGLFLSKDILTYYPYDSYEHNESLLTEGPSWDKSVIREFLNGEFLNDAFTSDEMNKMGSMASAENASAENSSKVFLLPVDKFNSVLPNEYKAATSTPYAESIREIMLQEIGESAPAIDTTYECWMLIDTFKAEDWVTGGIYLVGPDGESSNAFTLAFDNSDSTTMPHFAFGVYGVRPAIVAELDAVKPVGE